MRYYIIILLSLVSLKSFGQPDTIKKPEKVLIHLGRPTTETNQALFIVDGKPFTYKEVQNMKPETIESVSILKDSAATALYGKDGINGVIIIKTKKFSKRELRKMKKKNSLVGCFLRKKPCTDAHV